jgi:hypothetical protein
MAYPRKLNPSKISCYKVLICGGHVHGNRREHLLILFSSNGTLILLILLIKDLQIWWEECEASHFNRAGYSLIVMHDCNNIHLCVHMPSRVIIINYYIMHNRLSCIQWPKRL